MKKLLPVLLFLIPAAAFVVMFSLWHGDRQEYESLLEEGAVRELALMQEVSSLDEEITSVREELALRESQLALSRERSRQLEGYIEERADNPEIKIAYITIDDGPSPLTGELLEVLEKKNVPATFFVIGPEEPELEIYYPLIADAGHPFGNHSYHHDYPSLYSGIDEFFKDIELQDEFLSGYTDRPVRLFRFPGGSNNPQPLINGGGEGMFSQVKDQLAERGYIYFDWNVFPDDAAGKPRSVKYMVDRMKEQIFYRKNVTILLHDHETNTTTPEALEEIIDHLAEEGYCILPLSENTRPVRF